MRLQVSIKRHSLPTTNIIFTTCALGPSPATSSPDATIAQLLEDVNDIVPLESADWGLEDYVVEVNSYECLHFSPIDAVLRDDDQVVIRALKTQDLRSRRLGGRHQISSHGRHLIDGVAFGRQWLIKGGRPAVQIPPRKRRLKIEGAAENPEEDAARPLALGGIDDADEFAYQESDEEDDSDFVDEGVDALVDDESDGETGPSFMIDTEPDLRVVARQDFQDADDEAQDSSEEDDSDSDISAEEAGWELSAELQALREEQYSHSSGATGERLDSLKQTLTNDSREVRTDGRKRKLRSDHYSQNGDEIEFNGFSSPLAKRTKTAKSPASPGSDSDSTSSSGSDTDEGCEPAVSLAPSKTLQILDGSADSDSSSKGSEETSSKDSESGSDAVSEDESHGSSSSSSSSSQTSDISISNDEARSKTQPRSNAITSSEKMPLPLVNVTSSTRSPVPPGQGLKRTHYSNQRQKKRHRLKILKEQGLLPENATFADMAAYDEALQTASLGPVAAVAKIIEAKKQELLEQVEEQVEQRLEQQVPELASDEVLEPNLDLGGELPNASMHNARSALRITEPPATDASSEQLFRPHTPLSESHARDVKDSLDAPVAETKSEPLKQRARLDLNSTRNMIFSGLGVRKPKTVAAEQALREQLAKPAKGALPKQLFKDATTKQDGGLTMLDQSQISWQNKLTVSAVECELEGVTLTPPPFPFVQGWDEDANRRLRNNKKKSRSQRQYYGFGEATFLDGYEEQEEAHDEDDSLLHNEACDHDIDDKLPVKAGNPNTETSEQLDANASDFATGEAEELPRPSNIDSLHPLQQQDARPGAVIAYKEFHLNVTNLQPEISAYRIARVEAVRDDGNLDLRLSKRDRKPPKVVRYDAETGQRILSRSEMWEGSDEADEDDGYRLLSYSDLVEPKTVQASNTSEPAASMSLGEEDKNRNKPSTLTPHSVVIPESMVSDSFAIVSAQQPAQAATAADTENDCDIDVANPRRTEILSMIKEAGFNSTLDSEIGRPIGGMTENTRQRSPSLNVVEGRRSQSRETPADPTSEAQRSSADTSGFGSPRFNGWSSSPPFEPEPDEVTEEIILSERVKSSQSDEAQQAAVGNVSSRLNDDVTYPHIPQLEPDASMPEIFANRLDPESGRDSPTTELPTQNSLGGAVHLDDSSVKLMDEKHLDSLESTVPPSINRSQETGEAPARNATSPTGFVDELNGRISSDDDELPSLARITSTARSRSSRLSPPRTIVGGKGKTARRGRSTTPLTESIASETQQSPMKQSQSQVGLSQIPPESQVVDLTISSGPLSPGNSNGAHAKPNRVSRTRHKGKKGANETEGDKSDALAASIGLGNRRLLKSKKAKP